MGCSGGGIGLIVRDSLRPITIEFPGAAPSFETLWVLLEGCCPTVYVSGIYHSPSPIYSTVLLRDYLEVVLEGIMRDSPSSLVVLAGDVNQLPDKEVIDRTGLMSIVYEPTGRNNILDRIYVSAACYPNVKIIKSSIKSDHSAIVAYHCGARGRTGKTSTSRTYRKCTPTLHAVFLANGTSLDFRGVLEAGDPSTALDRFYDIALAALDRYYLKKTVSITNNEQCFLTPTIKSMLRPKNSLMHSGRIEEASAIATRVGKSIAKFNSIELRYADNRTGIKEL